MRLGTRTDNASIVRYILNRIIQLEEEKQVSQVALLRAKGDRALQLRAHVVVLERQLRWYRGRIERQTRKAGLTHAEEVGYGRAQRKVLHAGVVPHEHLPVLPQREDKGRVRPNVPFIEGLTDNTAIRG